jgi:hypothetical protein
MHFVALKINKNKLEARKLWPPEIKGVIFTKKNLDHTAHNQFLSPSKNP